MEDIKRDIVYLSEQYFLRIMDKFKGQDNDTLRELFRENSYDAGVVPHNLTNTFHSLYFSVNQLAKSFIQNKYKDWFADQVSPQL